MPSSDHAADRPGTILAHAGRAVGAATIGVASFGVAHVLAGPLDGLFFSIPLMAVFLSGLLGSTWTALVTMAAFSLGAASTDPRVSGLHVAHTVETYRFVGFVAIGLIAAWVSGRASTAYARSREAHARAVRAADEAAHAKRELERVMSIVGHDLRTPLSAIQMNATLMQRQDATPRQRAALDRISASCTRIARLISDLADLGRTLRGEVLPLDRGVVELVASCRQVAAEFQDGARHRLVEVDASGEVLVDGDRDRIMQVVANLLGNAVQHGAVGARIRLAVRRRADDALVSVHNFGPPIPPATVASMFEAFTRGDPANAGTMRGSVGLGLFIARQITVAHGGEIAVSSDAEHGTTFTVRLRALDGRSQAAAGGAPREHGSER